MTSFGRPLPNGDKFYKGPSSDTPWNNDLLWKKDVDAEGKRLQTHSSYKLAAAKMMGRIRRKGPGDELGDKPGALRGSDGKIILSPRLQSFVERSEMPTYSFPALQGEAKARIQQQMPGSKHGASVGSATEVVVLANKVAHLEAMLQIQNEQMNEMAKAASSAQKAAEQATAQLSRRTPRTNRVNSAAASGANVVMSSPSNKKLLGGSFIDSANISQSDTSRGQLKSVRSDAGNPAVVPPLQLARAASIASARSHGVLTPGMPVKKMKLQQKALRLKLRAWEQEFEERNGYPVSTVEDLAPVAGDFKRYQALKAKLQSLK